ncbi:MAG: hypothetical protein J0I19_16900 [Alphaproteobacteria bacterium]|nr:hypothetical protein [Alphaproteobacteria bacterium]
MILGDTERLAWLRLARTRNIGPVAFANLTARFGSATAALKEVPRMAQRGGAGNFILPPESEAERELAGLEKLGGRLIAACEPDFPSGLAALDPRPPLISAIGNIHLLQKNMIA